MTDRRRVSGLGQPDERRRLIDLAGRAIDAGVDVIQLRERDLDAGVLTAWASELVSRAAGSRTRIVVNDRLDVALASGAHGIHLRGDSLPPASARAITPPGFLIGRSVHSVEEVRGAQDHVDYLIAGTVWATQSKAPGSALLGIDGLRLVVRAASVPVLAIGGVTLGRIPEVARAGAAGCAAIGLFADEPVATASEVVGASGSLGVLVREARALYARSWSS